MSTKLKVRSGLRVRARLIREARHRQWRDRQAAQHDARSGGADVELQSQLHSELSQWAVATGDPRLLLAVDALVELGLSALIHASRIAELVGDPGNDMYLRARVALRLRPG